MKFFGDIIVVEHLDVPRIASTLLEIPIDAGPHTTLVQARVIGVGHVAKEKRKKGRYYAIDDVNVGDIVLVPYHLGSRKRIPSNSKAIVYDGEDVAATV